jgi:hypothetical protein
MIPFSISAILIVFENFAQDERLKNRFRKYGLMLMAAGFIYLIGAVLLLFLAASNIHKCLPIQSHNFKKFCDPEYIHSTSYTTYIPFTV